MLYRLLGGVVLEVKIVVPDEKVQNFTESAKNRLKDQTQEYSIDIADEAVKFERLIRENGTSAEITETCVVQATRRYKTTKKKHLGLLILRIISEILLAVAGFMFLPNAFVNDQGEFNLLYFFFFVLVLAAAIITTIISHFVEGD